MKKLILIVFLQCFFSFYSAGQITTFNNKSLTKNELSNIIAFAKVYGYVRHFYPSTEVDQMKNWEKLIVDYLPKIENSTNNDELTSSLSAAFNPYAPLLRINNKASAIYDSSMHPGTTAIVFRKNNGWGNRGENAQRVQPQVYTSEIIRIAIDSILPKDILPPNERLVKQVSTGLAISWPMALYANDSFTWPHHDDFINDTNKYTYYSANRYVRLGCIIELCNVMQHFYPYLHDLKIDNNKILEKYVQLASMADSEEEFFQVLELFGAEYKDSHAAFMPYPKSKWADYVPPLRLEWIQEKLIATFIENTDSTAIAIGDEIISINNIPAKEWYKNKSERTSSATTTWNIFATCKELLCGALNSTLTLKIKPAKGEEKTITVKRNQKVDALEKKANTRLLIDEYKPGYYYIDLRNLNDSMMDQLELNILPKATGIVFDFRGYPRVRVEKLFRHICSDTMYSAIWQIPIAYYPDQDKMNTQCDTSGRWKIAPANPRFTNNVVFIIDGRVISGAETEMGMVENYKIGKIIGEQSAGTNGNINTFQVYGLYYFWFTGMKVLKHDGSQHHGVGIIPQIKVRKTIKDVRTGCDPFIKIAKQTLH